MRVAREQQFSATHRIDEYERDQAVGVLEACLKLGDRASAEWLLAEPAFLLGRWPTTYAVLAESPWPDLVSRTLAANAKDIEIVAWYPAGGASPRMLMTEALRAAADRTIRAVQPPDLAHLAEAMYAAMPVVGPEETNYGSSGYHFTCVYSQRLLDAAGEFPRLKFEDDGLRRKTAELLLAPPTWWLLKDELFAWGAGQKTADVCRMNLRDVSGGRMMRQYAAGLVMLVNDGKPQEAMKGVEAIRAEFSPRNPEAPHAVLDDVRQYLHVLLTGQPAALGRQMRVPLARGAGDYVEFARAVCLSETELHDSYRDLGEAVIALYAAAGRPEEIAGFSEEFAVKTGQRDPRNAAMGAGNRWGSTSALSSGCCRVCRRRIASRPSAGCSRTLRRRASTPGRGSPAPNKARPRGSGRRPCSWLRSRSGGRRRSKPLPQAGRRGPRGRQRQRRPGLQPARRPATFAGRSSRSGGWHGANQEDYGGRWGRVPQ